NLSANWQAYLVATAEWLLKSVGTRIRFSSIAMSILRCLTAACRSYHRHFSRFQRYSQWATRRHRPRGRYRAETPDNSINRLLYHPSGQPPGGGCNCDLMNSRYLGSSPANSFLPSRRYAHASQLAVSRRSPAFFQRRNRHSHVLILRNLSQEGSLWSC